MTDAAATIARLTAERDAAVAMVRRLDGVLGGMITDWDAAPTPKWSRGVKGAREARAAARELLGGDDDHTAG